MVLASAPPYNDDLCPPRPRRDLHREDRRLRSAALTAGCEKGFNVLQGGAAGMILYNPTLADVETDNHWLPTVHLADGTDSLAFMDGHTGVTGTSPLARSATARAT